METLNQVLLHKDNLVSADLDAWLAHGGGEGLRKALDNPPEQVALIEQANLRGMGGAGFPTYFKWRALAMQQDAEEKYLICNANEDEPGTFKDRFLLEQTPHQVIEGALIAAVATGANHIVLYINPHLERAIEIVRRAVEQWKAHDLYTKVERTLGKQLILRVFLSSGLYIGGEETAVISTVEGKFPFPRRKPPYPAEQGVHGLPTLINNTETLAHVPHIARHGARWYQELGLGNASGTKLYSLSGDVLRPGLYELPMGTSLHDLIYTYGGGMLQGKEFKAVFTGGPSNTILTKQDLDVPLDFDSLQARHSWLGTGAMIVISEGTSLVGRVKEYIAFFASSSCGQCPSCKIGTYQIAHLLEKIDNGQGLQADLDMLINLCKVLPGSGRCGLLDGAITVLDSTLHASLEEYQRPLMDRSKQI